MQAQAKYEAQEEVSLAFKRHILEKSSGFASEPMADLYRVQTLGMMLDRYEALLEGGYGPQNARQRVMDEFADIAARMRDMGFEAADRDAPLSRWPQLTEDEAERYIRERDAYQHRIALGAALCTACVSPMMLFGALEELFFGFAGGGSAMLGVVGMLGMIALGVYLIVTAVKPKDDKKVKKGHFSLGSRLRRQLSQIRELMDKRARSRKGKGIVLMVLCIVPVMLGAAVDEIFLWRFTNETGSWLGVAGMFAMIAAGVYELVMADGEKKTMKRLLNQDE